MIHLLKFATLFIMSTLLISGCAVKKTESDVKIQYNLVKCASVDRNIHFELEKPGNASNEVLFTRNLIRLDSKLQEAFAALTCYENQVAAIENRSSN